MNIYLGHLSNYIPGPKASTAVRSILECARTNGNHAFHRMPERTLAMRLPAETRAWLCQQAETQDCSMAEVVRSCIAKQIVAELTELYQQHTATPAEFSAALWSALGYAPESSPGEEMT
jgi:hypothetical protein